MVLLKCLTLCTVVAMVFAKECPKGCTREYFPVCGSDLMTYSNLCLLKKANCGRPDDDQIFIIHNGRCHIDSCPGACTMDYFPVCGTDGVTYGNICGLENAHCENPEKKITLAYHGVCKNLWCPKVCTKDYKPVCGSDNITYPNLCSLEASNCDRPRDDHVTVFYTGECVSIHECDRPCPLNYDPVCGKDRMTYGNLCVFEIAHCKDNTLEIAYPGECTTEQPECPRHCPLIWLPICGSNGKTYANRCQLDAANCNKKPEDKITIKYEGECQTTQTGCPVIICPLIYAPVCGSDGNTYVNECYIRSTNCRRPDDDQISIKYPGECTGFSCPKFCPLIWDPLCGTDKVTYGNMCHMEVANCGKKDEDRIKKSHSGVYLSGSKEIKVSSGGISPICPQVCDKSWAPVCGSNGLTYANECYVTLWNCKAQPGFEITIIFRNACENYKSSCPQDCPLEWAPVCGSDKQTYGNMCHLEVANCQSSPGNPITWAYDGVCVEP